MSRSRQGACPHGKRQMSSTPLVAWAFEFPSGSAIFPSITIGVFQCPPPQARSASCTPVSDRYTRSPPPGAYTNRSVSATIGLVPALRLLHTGCSWPLLNRHAAVPPPSAANNPPPSRTGDVDPRSVSLASRAAVFVGV